MIISDPVSGEPIDNPEIPNAIKTFRNLKFLKRDFDSVNIVFCQAVLPPDEDWVGAMILKMLCPRCGFAQV